jgi:hypothetical protein
VLGSAVVKVFDGGQLGGSPDWHTRLYYITTGQMDILQENILFILKKESDEKIKNPQKD